MPNRINKNMYFKLVGRILFELIKENVDSEI